MSSTEIQLTRSSEWKEVQSYPHSAVGLKGATLNNVVYMTGQDNPKHYILILVFVGGYDDEQYDSIYKYDAEADQWALAGNLQTKRFSHAVSVVKKSQVVC